MGMVVDQRRMTLFYILIALHFPAGKKKKKKRMNIQQEMQMLQKAPFFLNFSEIMYIAAHCTNKNVS